VMRHATQNSGADHGHEVALHWPARDTGGKEPQAESAQVIVGGPTCRLGI
jgi:hypothetical protein